MFRLFDPLRTALALLLFGAGVLRALTGDVFALEILAETAVFAIAAMAFDLLAGFPRLVSMGHGLFVGTGAYVYAGLTVLGGLPPAAAAPAAVLGAGVAGLLVGLATVRTRDVFFLMATLAFGQMAHVFVLRSPALGGDDGLTGVPRPDLSALGVDLFDGRTFALAAVLLAALVYLLLGRLLASAFGRTLLAIGADEGRVRALGIGVARHRVAAAALSGAVAGLAGVLAACHAMYVSPGLFHWTFSGEVLTMALVGGVGSLVGPVLGAALVVELKYAVAAWTAHWGAVLGLFLVAAVWAGGDGIYGRIARAAAALRRRLRPGPGGAHVRDGAGSA